ncbi:MAG: tRNA (adenosine(37)-N6)-dimethylallyltransferase MiaA [Limisphaerales bacterium]
MNECSIFVAGPTAVGKSAIALRLAKKINGEIISVDSMQVYRGLDIGTAKSSPQERGEIPHHLIDVVDLNESFDAAQFCRLAEKAVIDIQARNRIPIFCGGTGFYFKAFLEGLGEAPPSNETIRVELKKKSWPDLLEELKQLDPTTFEKIDRQNPRRVIRALEVIHLTGKPFSEQRADWRGSETGERKSEVRPRMSGFFFGLAREDLRDRINLRVEKMFQRGLVAETEELLKRGLAKNNTAMQAIGYRQVVEHLRGQRSLPETKELVKIKTRQFAKRQMTWFRRQAKLEWINIGEKENESSVADRLVKEMTTKV